MQFSLPMFEAFTRGFLKEAGQTLGAREIELLPMGAKLMTLECGMRFLADYLNGDKYFRVHREGHNLDRARTQFKLVRCMEESWAQMADLCAIARNKRTIGINRAVYFPHFFRKYTDCYLWRCAEMSSIIYCIKVYIGGTP